MEKLRYLSYDLLGHPHYFPDLAPSDFQLFPNLKKFVSGKHFMSSEVKKYLNEYINSLTDSHFREGILVLEKCWAKCVEVKGDYVETKSFFIKNHFSPCPPKLCEVCKSACSLLKGLFLVQLLHLSNVIIYSFFLNYNYILTFFNYM